jgi:hypothetical protein
MLEQRKRAAYENQKRSQVL